MNLFRRLFRSLAGTDTSLSSGYADDDTSPAEPWRIDGTPAAQEHVEEPEMGHSVSDPRHQTADPFTAALQRVKELREAGDIEGLIEGLSSEWAGFEASSALQEIGAPAIPLLATAFANEQNSWRREVIVRILGGIENLEVVAPLVAALKDESEQVRFSAAVMLTDLADPRAIEPLLEVLEFDEAKVRLAAVTALGRISDPRVVQPLITALLEDPHYNVRSLAAEGLAKVGDGRAIEPLTAAVDDSDEWVRGVAREALETVLDRVGG